MNNFFIIENQYFPNVNWFKYSFQNKYIIIFKCESFKKMTFRNRTVICGANGLINLSVPIENGRDQKLPFNEIRISYRDNWQLNHWRGILSCYGKSPFFDFYRNDLENLLNQKHAFLFDLNLEILQWLKKVLKFPPEIQVVESLKGFEEADDLSNKWLPKNFQDGEVEVKYAQVFEDRIGFQPNVSILDLLFNTGPAARNYLL